MRESACRIQAQSSRNGILASIRLADTNPTQFMQIARTNQAREQAIQGQRAAAYEQGVANVRRDLETLSSASPKQVGLATFGTRLTSLDRSLRILYLNAPPGSDLTLRAIQGALDAFRVARERWREDFPDAEEVYQEALPVAANALAWVTR
jgi:hypothetical protein